MPSESYALYPVFLKLAGVRVVVVGGGRVAESKLSGLLAAGAHVTVIAPAIRSSLRDLLTRSPESIVIERAFRAADLDGARWVVAAAPPEINRAVADSAAACGIFVNAVDDPAVASAYLGGVIRRGQIEIAISTGGTAPALAGLLREALEAVLPEDLEQWHQVAIAARAQWKASQVAMADRRPLLLQALSELYRQIAIEPPAPPETPTRVERDRLAAGVLP